VNILLTSEKNDEQEVKYLIQEVQWIGYDIERKCGDLL